MTDSMNSNKAEEFEFHKRQVQQEETFSSTIEAEERF